VSGTAEQGRSYRDTATGRLLLAYRQDGDARARDRLVQLYLPLVETLAQRYARADAEHEDLVQAGSIGLLNAIERYDPRRGDEFAAFAVPTIAGEIKRHLRDRTAMVKLPRRLQEAGTSLPRVREQLTAKLEREPTERELAAALELEPEELGRLQEAQRSGPLPNDEVEAIVDAGSDDRLDLAGAFHVLDDEERTIVQLRYINDLPAADTATRLGLSERQLARRTQAALAKLRTELEGGSPSMRERPANGGATTPATTDSGSSAKRPAAEPAEKEKTSHSGRLLLRMPQSLHAELARAAEREETSLNQFITNSLAASVGWRQPTEARGDDEPEQQPTSADAQPRWLRAALVTNIVVVALAAIVAVVLLVVAWQQGL
jgi:RNA polymerase sigma-B factor